MPSSETSSAKTISSVARLFALLVVIGFTSGQQILSNNLQKFNTLSQFSVVYEWKVLDFAFATEDERSRALFSGRYIPKNVLISDCKPYMNRLYLTIPRMRPGVPATLGYVVRPENNGRPDPEIVPYPSWEMNERGKCLAFQIAESIAIDKHGIMWVVDSGRTETYSRADYVVCPPKLVLLDPKRNGTVLLRYEFPESVVPPGNNNLNKVVVDDAYGGFAYITQTSPTDPGIVVFSARLLRSWKIRESYSMSAARNSAHFTVNGTELNFPYPIAGIALGPYYNRKRKSDRKDERNVYYCPLSSNKLYALPATLLRDPELIARATPQDIYREVSNYGEKSSQTDGMIMDNQGVLYYGLLGEHAIARWDTYKPFTPKNQQIVARDPTYIQWVDSMGFDHEGYLYVTINRLHNFVAGRLNPLEVNFRILRAKTSGLSYVETANYPFNSDTKYLSFGYNDLHFAYNDTTPASKPALTPATTPTSTTTSTPASTLASTPAPTPATTPAGIIVPLLVRPQPKEDR